MNDDLIYDTKLLNNGLSYRQIISYVAQCAGGFAYINSSNKLAFSHFDISAPIKSFNQNTYKRLELADYEVATIDGVWSGVQDGDVGTLYTETSDPENILRIYNNPFLALTDTGNNDIPGAVENIYDIVSTYSYIPFRLESFLEKWFIWNGEVIEINNGITTRNYIPFSLTWNKSGMTMESTGEPDRNKVQMFSSAEQRMSGKFNIFQREIDETTSQIGDVRGNISTVQQTVDGVQLTLQSNIDGVQDNLDDHAETQLQYIQYGADGLTLGKENSSTKTRLTNERLEFIDGTGDIKGYIGYDSVEQTYKFYITNGHINNYLEFGDKFSAIASADGHHLTFKGKV